MDSETPRKLDEHEKEEMIHALGLPEELTSLLLVVLRGRKDACLFETSQPLADISGTGLLVKTMEMRTVPLGKNDVDKLRRKFGDKIAKKFLEETLRDSVHYFNYVALDPNIAQELFAAAEKGDHQRIYDILDGKFARSENNGRTIH